MIAPEFLDLDEILEIHTLLQSVLERGLARFDDGRAARRERET